MSIGQKRITLLGSGQFDPFLRDGASRSWLSRLQFLQGQGRGVLIVDFIPYDDDHRIGLESHGNEAGSPAISRAGDSFHAIIQGIPFYQCLLPLSCDQLTEKPQSSLKAVMSYIQREPADYIFTVDEGYAPLFAAWFLKVPGAHFFNSVPNIESFTRNPQYIRFLEKRAVFVNSRFMRTKVKSLLGLDSAVWPSFINFDDYRSDRAIRDINAARVIGFRSGSGRKKGGDIVMEIARRMPEFSFLIAGVCDRLPDILPPNLSLLGQVADMNIFYEKVALLLVPSLIEEAFPRVILEAAARGIPVIGSRVGGIPEALGDSGVLIDVAPKGANSDEVAERYVREIRRVLDNEEIYRGLRQKALARAREYEIEQLRIGREVYERYIR
jgi:glycosyltransferase involved in cell wall biosynthesis